jgi:hypothetical protein
MWTVQATVSAALRQTRAARPLRRDLFGGGYNVYQNGIRTEEIRRDPFTSIHEGN